MSSQAVAERFLAYARSKLSQDYLPKIHQCLGELSPEEVWWRPNPSSNSVGNILLHLSGNVRQWIIHGIGGEEDVRNRPREFTEREQLPKEELLSRLTTTLQQADAVLSSLSCEDMLQKRTIQGFDETTLSAIFHVVEHFAQHLGQITYITKMKKDIDLKYFDLNEDGYSKKK